LNKQTVQDVSAKVDGNIAGNCGWASQQLQQTIRCCLRALMQF